MVAKRPYIGVKDVNQAKFTKALAAFLKRSGKVKQPEWADLVKLCSANELCPSDHDWFFVRSASILRRLYCRAPVGITAFTKVYGKIQRRGTAPSHHKRANGNIIRKCLQQMEALGLVDKHANGGRILTSQGRRDLDRIAYQVQQGAIQAAAAANKA